MSLLEIFGRSRSNRSAHVARERLKVIVAHERRARNAPDYLPAMQNEILNVIRKYVEIEHDDLQIDINEDSHCSVLEVNVNIPK